MDTDDCNAYTPKFVSSFVISSNSDERNSESLKYVRLRISSEISGRSLANCVAVGMSDCDMTASKEPSKNMNAINTRAAESPRGSFAERRSTIGSSSSCKSSDMNMMNASVGKNQNVDSSNENVTAMNIEVRYLRQSM